MRVALRRAFDLQQGCRSMNPRPPRLTAQTTRFTQGTCALDGDIDRLLLAVTRMLTVPVVCTSRRICGLYKTIGCWRCPARPLRRARSREAMNAPVPAL